MFGKGSLGNEPFPFVSGMLCIFWGFVNMRKNLYLCIVKLKKQSYETTRVQKVDEVSL